LEKPPQGLVFFDVEGVFFPRKRFLLFAVTKNFPKTVLIKLSFYILLYWLRIIDTGKLASIAYRNLKGVTIQLFIDTYSKLPLIKRAEKTISDLRSHGYITVLSSSGLPQEVVDALNARVGADLAFGVRVQLDAENKLTGRIEGEIAGKKGKLEILESLSRELEVSADKVYIVADDRNNLQLLKAPHKLFIGFNPDAELKAKSDINVTGDNLHPVFDIIRTGKKSKIFSKWFFVRKLIHISGIATIFFASLFGILATQLVILLILSFYLPCEYLRLSGKRLPVVTSIIQIAATSEELWGIPLNPLWYALGILLVLTIFPLHIAAVGVLTLCIGDSIAGITGEMLERKHRYPFSRAKSVEGTILGLLSAVPLCLLFVNPFIGLIACTVRMIFEALPLPANDNLSIPFFTSLTAFLLTNYFIFA